MANMKLYLAFVDIDMTFDRDRGVMEWSMGKPKEEDFLIKAFV